MTSCGVFYRTDRKDPLEWQLGDIHGQYAASMAVCGWHTESVCSNRDPETYHKHDAAYCLSAVTWHECWAGWISDTFFCTYSRECIDYISFSSVVMRCVVVGHVVPDVLYCSAFKTCITTCPVTQFHMSKYEYS